MLNFVQINRFILVTIARRMERGGGRLSPSFLSSLLRVKVPGKVVYQNNTEGGPHSLSERACDRKSDRLFPFFKRACDRKSATSCPSVRACDRKSASSFPLVTEPVTESRRYHFLSVKEPVTEISRSGQAHAKDRNSQIWSGAREKPKYKDCAD